MEGNHDAAVLGRLDVDVFNEHGPREPWSGPRRRHLPATRAWLEALPERRVEGDFTLVHGSPRDPLWEYLYSMPAARRSFGAYETPHCLVGHTHHPLVVPRRRWAHRGGAPRGMASRLDLDERRCILNPGASASRATATRAPAR